MLEGRNQLQNCQQLSEEQKKKANSILYEYFYNNRYPKKVEKLKLAERAGVTLQYVINFFYNTRSRIKNIERQQYFCANTQRVLPYFKESGAQNSFFTTHPNLSSRFGVKDQIKRYNIFHGNNNSLYISLPLVRPNLYYEQDNEEREDVRYNKINVLEDTSIENINNASSIY